ncbi:MAG: mercuric transporter MerT family protein [Gemmatimonadota bacterium]
METGKLATRGALGGGVLGTTLVVISGCLGAKVLLLVGVSAGALGWLSNLEPYRLPLAGVAFVAFGFAGWRIYRSRRLAVEAREIST